MVFQASITKIPCGAGSRTDKRKEMHRRRETYPFSSDLHVSEGLDALLYMANECSALLW